MVTLSLFEFNSVKSPSNNVPCKLSFEIYFVALKLAERLYVFSLKVSD